MSMTNDDSVNELASRLCAAYVSFESGLTTVDYTLRNYRKDSKVMGHMWQDLAKALIAKGRQQREGYRSQK